MAGHWWPTRLFQFRCTRFGGENGGLTRRIAVKTSRQTAQTAASGILSVRKRPRPDKHLLTSNERWEAVRGAFATRPGSQVDKQRVLLVDDVMTTGATLDACAKALREAGASSVLGLTVARAHPEPAEGQPVRSG